MQDQKQRVTAYLDSLNPKNPEWFEEIYRYATTHSVPVVNKELGRLLYFLNKLYKPTSILELGTGIGCSAHWMLLGHNASVLTTIEQNKDRIAIAEKYFSLSGLKQRVTLCHGWVKDFFAVNKKKYDFIFIDSQKNEYASIIDDCVRVLNPQGILVADNVFFKKNVIKKRVPKKYQRGTESIRDFNTQCSRMKTMEAFFFSFLDGVLIAQKQE